MPSVHWPLDTTPKMTYIVGQGSSGDPHSLDLQTRKKWRIPNELRPELPPAARMAAISIVTKEYPSARALSSSGQYNCAGLVFGSRRVVIDVEHTETILRDDGYAELDWFDRGKWDTGDVVMYRNAKQEPSHVAVVHSVTPDPAASIHTVTVISAWGQSGEYCHEMGNVSPLLGTPQQIWSKRLIHD